MDTSLLSAAESVAVIVTLSPAVTGWRGEADSDTVGVSSSSMVTATEVGTPATTVPGRFAVSSATVKVSSSMSSSWRVARRPVPLVRPLEMRMPVSVPRSSASAVPRVTVTGTVTDRVAALESVAVTVTLPPSFTGFGAAASDTVASSSSR